MPAPIYFAHKILKVLSDKRRSGAIFDLQPDAKSQVTVQYVNNKPIGCTKVVVSTQHNEKSRNGKKYSPGLIKDMRWLQRLLCDGSTSFHAEIAIAAGILQTPTNVCLNNVLRTRVRAYALTEAR